MAYFGRWSRGARDQEALVPFAPKSSLAADFTYDERGLSDVRATLGGTNVAVESAGPDSSGVPGLDQVNIRVQADFQGRGYLDLVVTVDGIPSNTTSVQILGGRETPPAPCATPRVAAR
jgi:uncharacterized protein (TIGR03437 family)